MTTPLSAPLDLAFDYTRSTGPTIGAFLTALAEHRLVGAQIADGRVLVPPPEFDPGTGAPITSFVDVGPDATVLSWTRHDGVTWVLAQPDGADCPMLQRLVGADDVTVGMRVRPHWSDDEGVLALSFEPGTTEATEPAPAAEPVTQLVTPFEMRIMHSASVQESEHLRGLARGELIGARIGPGSPIYIPPRGADPIEGIPTNDYVKVADTGTVTTFCIVNVPFLGQRIKPPYVSAYILLDGADIAIQHLILECDAADVRMGMRVQAKWRPESEWGYTMRNIEYFRPTGEPDAAYETYRHHL